MTRYLIALISFLGITQTANADLSSGIRNYDIQLVNYLLKKGIIKRVQFSNSVLLNEQNDLYKDIRKSAETEISSKALNCTGDGTGL